MTSRLRRLTLSNIRNLKTIDLRLGPNFNVFVGPNGSGKTSMLEGVHLLSMGRSFRARSLQKVVTFGEDACIIRGMLGGDLEDGCRSDVWLAVERRLDGGSSYKLGEKNEKSIVALTKMLPTQLIDVNSHLLIEGGPDNRRKFIDWGLFHVEHSFLTHWRSMQRALEQRNAALKQRRAPDAAWDDAFIKYAELVDSARREYVQNLSAKLLPTLGDLLGLATVSIEYLSGWNNERGLVQHLADNRALDLMCGYTNCGPHRAELLIAIDGRPVKEVLSRGQIKVFACAMLLARTQLLAVPQNSVFLIDDLHSELDHGRCRSLISAIDALGCQTLVTGIEAEQLQKSMHGFAKNVFHVEQGEIFERV